MNLFDFQRSIARWMQLCFGKSIAADRKERCDRFIEEALELVQAGNMPKADVLMLVDYVYGRPVGDLYQEVGGVMVTLAALVDAHNLDLQDCAVLEQERVFTKVEVIRQKQLSKPRNSPLPEGYSK